MRVGFSWSGLALKVRDYILHPLFYVTRMLKAKKLGFVDAGLSFSGPVRFEFSFFILCCTSPPSSCKISSVAGAGLFPIQSSCIFDIYLASTLGPKSTDFFLKHSALQTAMGQKEIRNE
jgi:hypothetical protein